MPQPLSWHSIEEGTALPSLTKHPTTRQLVKFAGASGDFYEIHYDKDFAARTGLPSVIVHGWLALGFVTQMVNDWIGENGWLKKIDASYRGIHRVDEDLICRGRVTRKFEEKGEYLAECEVWSETPQGQKGVVATAIVTLAA